MITLDSCALGMGTVHARCNIDSISVIERRTPRPLPPSRKDSHTHTHTHADLSRSRSLARSSLSEESLVELMLTRSLSLSLSRFAESRFRFLLLLLRSLSTKEEEKHYDGCPSHNQKVGNTPTHTAQAHTTGKNRHATCIVNRLLCATVRSGTHPPSLRGG